MNKLQQIKYYKISALQITLLLFLSSLLFVVKIYGISLGLNLTQSLPDKYFLILEGREYNINDYVAFRKKNKWYNHTLAKQIKGVEGDEIIVFKNQLFLSTNKEKKFLGYIKKQALDGSNLTPIKEGKIPKDYYLLIAPHIDSLDSRYEDIGLIHKSEIIARVVPIDRHIAMATMMVLCLYILLIFLVAKFLKYKYLTIFLLCFLFISPKILLAKDLGVYGELFEITETDLIQEIKNKLTNMEANGELQKLQENWQKQAIRRAERPKPVEKYQIATENRVYFYDPSISVKHDIHDHKGKLIAKEGKKVNPLDYQEMKQNLLFIDSDIEKQLHWALAEHKKNHSVIILVNGSIMQIMRDYKTRIYFDQNGFLFNSFKIKAVPAKVSQDGDLLRIEEFVL